jgi:hypothetical protein
LTTLLTTLDFFDFLQRVLRRDFATNVARTRFSSSRSSQHSIMKSFDQTRARSTALNEISWMISDKWVICVVVDAFCNSYLLGFRIFYVLMYRRWNKFKKKENSYIYRFISRQFYWSNVYFIWWCSCWSCWCESKSSKSWMLCSWLWSQSNYWFRVFISSQWSFVARIIVVNSWHRL